MGGGVKQSPMAITGAGLGSSGSAGMPSPMAEMGVSTSSPVVAAAAAAAAAAAVTASQAVALSGAKTSPARAMSHISGVRKAQLTHTNSLSTLPRFGVETAHEEELGKIFEDMDKWGIDLFQVSEYSNRHPLTAIMYTIFRVSSFRSIFLKNYSLLTTSSFSPSTTVSRPDEDLPDTLADLHSADVDVGGALPP